MCQITQNVKNRANCIRAVSLTGGEAQGLTLLVMIVIKWQYLPRLVGCRNSMSF